MLDSVSRLCKTNRMLQEITSQAGERTQFTKAVLDMVEPWLTGDDKKDVMYLSRAFRMIGFTLSEWRQLVEAAK